MCLDSSSTVPLAHPPLRGALASRNWYMSAPGVSKLIPKKQKLTSFLRSLKSSKPRRSQVPPSTFLISPLASHRRKPEHVPSDGLKKCNVRSQAEADCCLTTTDKQGSHLRQEIHSRNAKQKTLGATSDHRMQSLAITHLHKINMSVKCVLTAVTLEGKTSHVGNQGRDIATVCA